MQTARSQAGGLSRRALLLGAAAVATSASARAAPAHAAPPACGPGPAPAQPFQIERLDTATRYTFNRSLAEITRLRALPEGSQSLHALGTTEINFSAGFRFEVAASASPDGTICVRIVSGHVTFGLQDVTVYVAREFPPGSCAHAAILDHEEGHVAISRAVCADSADRLSSALETARQRGLIVSARSTEDGRDQLSAMLSAILDAQTANFSAEGARRNAQHDLPQSTDRTFRMCPPGSFDVRS